MRVFYRKYEYSWLELPAVPTRSPWDCESDFCGYQAPFPYLVSTASSHATPRVTQGLANSPFRVYDIEAQATTHLGLSCAPTISTTHKRYITFHRGHAPPQNGVDARDLPHTSAQWNNHGRQNSQPFRGKLLTLQTCFGDEPVSQNYEYFVPETGLQCKFSGLRGF